jgi:hypothetical protein
MWTFEQGSGELLRGGVCVAHGYAGFGDGKGNPEKQDVRNVGPIPRGFWRIQSLTEGQTVHGPYVMRLVPEHGTEVFGRSGFLIHGDSIKNPGTASHGCIILARVAREMVWKSGDRRLEVVA